MVSQTQPSFPVINFGKENIESGTNSWLSTSEKVVNALEEYGFFVANYDTISSGLEETVFQELEELFSQPTEYRIQNGLALDYGYIPGDARAPLQDCLRVGKISNLEGIQHFTNIMWPDSGNPHFCEAMHSYSKLSSELEETVIKMVFESYGVEKHLKSHAEKMSHHLKLIKYRAPETDELNVGNYPHSDNGFVTIIHQNQVNGLQVQTKQGEWIHVDFSHPMSFVVMAGDGFLAWSNGRIHAPLHRVIMNEDDEARYTLVQFSMLGGITKVPEELVDDEHPLQYKPFNHKELVIFCLQDEFHESESVVKTKAYIGV